MRKKIAKRKRRYILSKGAKITSEERSEDGFFTTRVDYLGYHIASSDWDELSAYQGVIACFPLCEEEPRTEEGE